MWRWWCFSLWLYFSGPMAKTTTFGSIFCVIIGRSQIFIDTQGAEFCNHVWQWYLCYIDVGLWACWLLAGTVTRRNHLNQTVFSIYAEYEALVKRDNFRASMQHYRVGHKFESHQHLLLEVRCIVDRPCKVDPCVLPPSAPLMQVLMGDMMIWDHWGKTLNCTERLRTLDQDTISSQS